MVFPSIIRSSKLHIRQQAYVTQLLLPAVSGDEIFYFVHCRKQQLFDICLLPYVQF